MLFRVIFMGILTGLLMYAFLWTVFETPFFRSWTRVRHILQRTLMIVGAFALALMVMTVVTGIDVLF